MLFLSGFELYCHWVPLKRATPVFIQRFFKIQNYCFASLIVLYTCLSKSNNLFSKTN